MHGHIVCHSYWTNCSHFCLNRFHMYTLGRCTLYSFWMSRYKIYWLFYLCCEWNFDILLMETACQSYYWMLTAALWLPNNNKTVVTHDRVSNLDASRIQTDEGLKMLTGNKVSISFNRYRCQILILSVGDRLIWCIITI